MKHDGRVVSVAFSPDDKTIATGSHDGTARLWDTGSGHSIGPPLVHQERVNSVEFSPDGKDVITRTGRAIRRWNAATGEPIDKLLERESVWDAVFSPDGKTILAASSDNGDRLWDVDTRQPIGPEFKLDGSVMSLAYSPDGKTIVAAAKSFYDAQGAARLWPFPL